MSTIEKLVASMRANRRGVRYDDLQRVFVALGWRPMAGGSGSHQRFDAPDGSGFVTVVRPHGGRTHVSPRAVEDLLSVWDDARQSETDDD